MNIAIISAGLSTHSGLRVPVELAISLTLNGHQVTIYAPKKGKDQKTIQMLKQYKVNVRFTPKTSIIKQVIELASMLKQERHQVINAYCFLPHLLAARLSHIPIVWTYHGTQFNALSEHFFPNTPLYIKVADKLMNFFIWIHTMAMVILADSIISISLGTANELKKLYFRHPTATIPWGAKPYTFPSSIKSKKNLHKIKILSVSRITPYKGFHKIIDSVNNLSRKYKNLELTIVGSSPLPNYLKYLKKISGENVKIRLNLSDPELTRLFQQTDIYATADKYLFFGLPVWEASGFALPSVAMDYKAAHDAVKHGKTGFVAKNTRQFERFLESLINSSSLRKKLGKNAKQLANNVNWQLTAARYEKAFLELLSKTYQPLVVGSFIAVFKQLNSANKIKLVDLGSDAGSNLKIIERLDLFRNVEKIIAVDKHLNPKLLKLARNNPKIIPTKADITAMKSIPSNSFDLAICAQVIEHTEKQKQAIREITRILKPSGKLFISSVAKRWYGIYWHRNYKGEIVVHPDHVHEFSSLKEFKELITSSGLKIKEINQIPGKLPLFDYFLRLINLFLGKKSSAEHRNIYLENPRLIKWHRRLSFFPLPGYSIVEVIATKQK